jgi:AcrR family transcriptional regulator
MAAVHATCVFLGLNLDELAMLAAQPPARRRVVEALLAGDALLTYRRLAEDLGISRGTVNRHLHCLRQSAPELHAAVMRVRSARLHERYAAATARAQARVEAWRRKQAHRRYYWRFSHWPRERGQRVAGIPHVGGHTP